jgi:hypothetical protein
MCTTLAAESATSTTSTKSPTSTTPILTPTEAKTESFIIKPNLKVDALLTLDVSILSSLVAALEQSKATFDLLGSPGRPGYIILHKNGIAGGAGPGSNAGGAVAVKFEVSSSTNSSSSNSDDKINVAATAAIAATADTTNNNTNINTNAETDKTDGEDNDTFAEYTPCLLAQHAKKRHKVTFTSIFSSILLYVR